MWSYTLNKEYLYCLECYHGGYHIVITDLNSVYYEEQNAIEISERGKHLEYALSNETQIYKFCEVLKSQLSGEKVSFKNISKVTIEDNETFPPLQWSFNLTKMNDSEAVKVFSNMSKNLLDVIGNMGRKINEIQDTIFSKDAIIRGLDDAVQRKVEYRVPKHLESHFKNKKERREDFKSEIDLANEFWPKDSRDFKKVKLEEASKYKTPAI